MIKKIMQLSKIFIKDYFQKINIFNKNKKINKKSVFTWLLLITIMSISFLSFQIINWLDSGGQAQLFLKVYFPIIATIFMFQAILICTNVFFFSKDLEHILPLPIKPIELLIAKFINVISITYGMELLFLATPLLMYGLIAGKSIIYFLTMILVLILFPIFLVTIISLIMLFIMQLTRFIKNKDIFQIIIILILTLLLSFSETYLLKQIFNDNIIQAENSQLENELLNNKLDKLNNYFIIINPCISLLTNLKIINIIEQSFKLIFICLISFIIFIYFGKILYLKNLLKNIAYINKNKNTKKILKNKYQKKSMKKAYIKNEFNKLIKNPTFFMQCIFQYISIITILLLIISLFMPIVLKSFEDQNTINKMGIDKFALQAICMILGILQIIFTFSNISLTAISRDGKNANVMKYIPVPLYKQFLWKNIPQISINTIVIISIAIVIWKSIPGISIWYYIAGIAIATLINIINSFLMVIVDLKNPYLDWTTEASSLRDNRNKLYQYVTTIINILLLTYLSRIFEKMNISISILGIFLIFFIIFLIIKKYIKKNIQKLLKKIY